MFRKKGILTSTLPSNSHTIFPSQNVLKHTQAELSKVEAWSWVIMGRGRSPGGGGMGGGVVGGRCKWGEVGL